MDGQAANQSEAHVADEAQKPQPQRGGKKGKKKQKYKPLDLSSIPDSALSSAAHGSGNQPQSSHFGGASSWGGNKTESTHSFQNTQGFGSSQQRYQSQGYYSGDRGSNVALSKALVTLLRHGKPRDIPLDGSGYASVNAILQHPHFQQFDASLRLIERLVHNDTKDRFELEKIGDGTFKIRATQGHSVRLDAHSSGLVPLTDPGKHSVIVHGTYEGSWRKIKKEGLKRMTRTHVHFAIGYIGETHVTSGMRNTCDVVIELDLAKALAGGLKFYESRNGVVLCKGDQHGSVSPKYFKVVKKWDKKQGGFKDINFQYEGE